MGYQPLGMFNQHPHGQSPMDDHDDNLMALFQPDTGYCLTNPNMNSSILAVKAPQSPTMASAEEYKPSPTALKTNHDFSGKIENQMDEQM